MKHCKIRWSLFALLLFFSGNIFAQDSAAVTEKVQPKPVKNTFGSVWLIDDQTVMVPIKGSMEMDIQHRFGNTKNGSKDIWGILGPANIRLALSYVPIKNLMVGVGLTKERVQVDLNGKYSIIQQTPGKWPVSVTYFANVAFDARNKSNFVNWVDRFSYYNSLMFARKITEKFSAQIAPTLSWFNNVEAYIDSKGQLQSKMKNAHFAFSILGRYKVAKKSAVIVGYDQPLTQHPANNPHPNLSFGFETTTSAHAFQVFMGNYGSILPESNNMLNQNDYRNGQWVIGFNITRLWNF